MSATSREVVYAAIDTERAYQEEVIGNKYGTGKIHPVAAEILMIQDYARRAGVAWTDNKGDEDALNVVRKVAALCVRCMENHGAPARGARL